MARSQEIGTRRLRKLAMLVSPVADVQFKMATTFGRRMTIKHMRDVPLYIDNNPWETDKDMTELPARVVAITPGHPLGPKGCECV